MRLVLPAVRVVLAAVVASVSVIGCYSYPSSSDTYKDQIVATRYDTGADFDAYTTFTVAPQVTYVDTSDPEATPEDLSDDVGGVLVDEVVQQLERIGYRQVDSEDAPDVGAKVTVLKGTAEGVDYVTYWGGYGFYSPYYWGYYYPYAVPVYYEYDTSVVRVDLVDVRSADPGDFADAEGSDAPPPDLRAIWTTVIYGVLESTTVEEAQQAALGIEQAFKQSPYLGGR